ncbi:hypothetical protein [Azohydromonas caseinilytica]|uniref:Uncharacterized protein n=1 Tax=Azohydromonas caseinilytica TaxID=2728836 RepID=A0A848FGY3_9BURK|nr:hypothetical protein [Azohydromonas caseinilytica]NML18522.1 hypothetical protein [Azohydromonas caseinilytica]
MLDSPRSADTLRPQAGAAPAASAAPSPAAGAAPRGSVFEASVAAGPLRLRIDSPALRHAPDAAIALQRCEALLEALEGWMKQPLHWRWTEIPIAPAPRGSQARAQWRLDEGSDGVSLQGSLELPWALLRALPAPEGVLAAWLQWPALPARLLLSCPRLSGEELERLEPGGALLLPESFNTSWTGLLRAASEPGGGVPVRLDAPLAPRLAAGEAPAASADSSSLRCVRPEPVEGPVGQPGARASTSSARTEPSIEAFTADGLQACEVRLDLPRALPAERLAGWPAGAVLDGAGPGATLWLRAQGRRPALCLARGRLMPWGSGWVLAVEALGESDDATLPVC